jgi:hypothetical protein
MRNYLMIGISIWITIKDRSQEFESGIMTTSTLSYLPLLLSAYRMLNLDYKIEILLLLETVMNFLLRFLFFLISYLFHCWVNHILNSCISGLISIIFPSHSWRILTRDSSKLIPLLKLSIL